jgi:hypothetical protein
MGREGFVTRTIAAAVKKLFIVLISIVIASLGMQVLPIIFKYAGFLILVALHVTGGPKTASNLESISEILGFFVSVYIACTFYVKFGKAKPGATTAETSKRIT